MRIPSGDLAPARRGRRRSRALPVALVLAVLAARAAAPTGCSCATTRPPPVADSLAADLPRRRARPRPAAPRRRPSCPRPSGVRFVLLNGTDRDGLAKRTGDALAARSFVVTRTGNPPSPLNGPSRVYYGPGALPAATLLVAQVEGAQLVAQPKARKGTLELVLGSGFRGSTARRRPRPRSPARCPSRRPTPRARRPCRPAARDGARAGPRRPGRA